MSSLNVCAHYVCTTYSFDFMLFDMLITTRLVTNSLPSQQLAPFNFTLVQTSNDFFHYSDLEASSKRHREHRTNARYIYDLSLLGIIRTYSIGAGTHTFPTPYQPSVIRSKIP